MTTRPPAAPVGRNLSKRDREWAANIASSFADWWARDITWTTKPDHWADIAYSIAGNSHVRLELFARNALKATGDLTQRPMYESWARAECLIREGWTP
jgi:alkylhydroperoxidase/carboxymuconolactone decarboxylase family protein YurZ